MNKKNILIIDDSALMRRVISDIINSDERFQVSKVLVNGLEAFDEFVQFPKKYDAIILDINMPKMTGLELLEQLDKRKIKQRIIVVSTLAKEGAKETIRALELGAFDFVTKPDSFIVAKGEDFKQQIQNTLAVATNVDMGMSKVRIPIRPAAAPVKRQGIKPKVTGSKLVALACSTGGPKALQDVIPYLPANLDAPVLLVQHMPQGFTKSLATRLNELSKIKVKEAEHGDILEKGVVYIAKGGYQMRLEKQSAGKYRIALATDPPRGGLRPCADIMYESLRDCDFDEFTCVVLTGMGGDGTNGISQLNEKKRVYVIAQNQETCTVYGMPKVIAESGLTDEVVPLNKVSDAIVKNVGVR